MTNKPRVRVPANLPGPAYSTDGLANFVTRLGSGGDKSRYGHYMLDAVANLDADAAYRTSWFRKIVDIPPFDEIREWRAWNGVDEAQITKITDEERRLDYRRKIRRARTLARKDGGSIILIGAAGDPSQELRPDRIGMGGIEYITVLTRDEVNPGDRQTDPRLPGYNEPQWWTLSNQERTRIHPTRVIKFTGNDVLSRYSWDGWNAESIWVELRTAVRNSDQIANAIAAMVEEAKLDVIRLKNLANNLVNGAGESALVSRFGTMNMLKSIANVLLLDGDDEYEQKTITFAGLPDIQDRALQIMSGVADIPATRLLGRSPQGMNATGESDLRNYYDRIRAGQTVELGPTIAPLDEMLIRSALGSRPEEVFYEWNPLYQITRKEAAEIEKAFAETAKIYADAALVPDMAMAEMVKGGLIERGQWPSAEKAYDEAGDIEEIERPTPEEIAAEEARQAALVNQRQQSEDAAPRSLYVSRRVVNAKAILAWAKAQGFSETLEADDLHVTVTYSRMPVDWMKMGASWEDEVKVPRGGPRVMEKFGDATVLLFASDMLKWRHEDMVRNGASWDHPEYQPHITISYSFDGDIATIEPYQGEIILGPEIFEEVNEDWRSGV